MLDGNKKKLSIFGFNSLETSEIEISGLTADSRHIKDGFLFAALPGTKAHGARFCEEAISKGCKAILTDAEGAILVKKIETKTLVELIIVEDPEQVFSRCVSIWFSAQPKVLTAVTGTNGKTSVASFVRQIWDFLGHKSVNIGTIGVEGAINIPLKHTTPDPLVLHKVLADAVEAGVTHACIEASSHGLDQRRLDGIRVLAAGFTNLSHDHLDYHNNLDSYFLSKVGLFNRILNNNGVAVINIDSAWGKRLRCIVASCDIKYLTIGKHESADIRILNQKFYSESQDFRFSYDNKIYQTRIELIGGFQVYNALLAAGLVISSGNDPIEVFNTLKFIKTVKGRMQRVATLSNNAGIYVDFAHTPDAIKTIIASIRQHVIGRVLIILGAGGDRDIEKREMMGRAAQEYADLVYITDDNPRHENPKKIRAMIKLGAPDAIEIPDRAEAILIATSELNEGDVLLIAGKGHETGQIVGDSVLEFDDAEQANIAKAILEGVI